MIVVVGSGTVGQPGRGARASSLVTTRGSVAARCAARAALRVGVGEGGFIASVEGFLLGCLVLLVCWYCVCVVLCQLSPFWPRILFGFRFLQFGIAFFGIFLSIKFNSIRVRRPFRPGQPTRGVPYGAGYVPCLDILPGLFQFLD